MRPGYLLQQCGIRLRGATEWPIGQVLLWLVASRAALSIIGLLSLRLLGRSGGCPHCGGQGLPDVWAGCDAAFYLDIAHHGYTGCLSAAGQSNLGFFPLYPLLVHAVSAIDGSGVASALIISNVCLLVGAIFLCRLVRMDEDDACAARCVRMLFVFPTAFMLSASQTEGLFFCLCVLCFYAARLDRWWQAGLWGCLAALTRPTGALMIAPLAWMCLRTTRRRLRWHALSVLLPPAGACLFGGYCYYVSGDFFAYAHAQAHGFGHHLANPFAVLYQGLISGVPDTAFSAWALYGVLCLLLLFSSRLRPEYTLFAICVLLATPVTGTVAGSLRYLSPLFPFFMLLSKATRRPSVERVMVVALALTQGGLMVLWVAGARALC